MLTICCAIPRRFLAVHHRPLVIDVAPFQLAASGFPLGLLQLAGCRAHCRAWQPQT